VRPTEVLNSASFTVLPPESRKFVVAFIRSAFALVQNAVVIAMPLLLNQ
jgi:hypothetical protein